MRERTSPLAVEDLSGLSGVHKPPGSLAGRLVSSVISISGNRIRGAFPAAIIAHGEQSLTGEDGRRGEQCEARGWLELRRGAAGQLGHRAYSAFSAVRTFIRRSDLAGLHRRYAGALCAAW